MDLAPSAENVHGPLWIAGLGLPWIGCTSLARVFKQGFVRLYWGEQLKRIGRGFLDVANQQKSEVALRNVG